MAIAGINIFASQHGGALPPKPTFWQRAFAIKPVLGQVTRSFQKIMGTLYRARRDFLGVVVVVERRGDKEGGFGSANERSR